MPRTHCANFTALPPAGSGLKPVSSLNFYFLSSESVKSLLTSVPYCNQTLPRSPFIQQIFIITDSNNTPFFFYNAKALLYLLISFDPKELALISRDGNRVSVMLSDLPKVTLLILRPGLFPLAILCCPLLCT